MNLIKLYNKTFHRELSMGHAKVQTQKFFRTVTRYGLIVITGNNVAEGKYDYTRKVYAHLMAYTRIDEMDIRSIVRAHKGKMFGNGGEIEFKHEYQARNAIEDFMALAKLDQEDPDRAKIKRQEIQVAAWGTSVTKSVFDPLLEPDE